MTRPGKLPAALLGAMRVLTDPVETGAVTIALPQDVQAEAFDWPVELFAERIWRIARPLPEQVDIQDAAALARAAKRPLIVAGGGVHSSGAEDALRALCEQTGIPVGEARPARGPSRTATPRRWGPSARRARRRPTRSRPTSSSTAWHALERLRPPRGRRSRTRACGSSTSTSRASTPASTPASRSWPTPARPSPHLPRHWRGMPWASPHRERQAALWAEWDAQVEAAYHPPAEVTDALAEGLLTQGEVLG